MVALMPPEWKIIIAFLVLLSLTLAAGNFFMVVH
jgi:hypothetical protein